MKDRLPYCSDYLVGHAECAATFVTDKNGGLKPLKAYPEGEERETINAAFDGIVADLKQKRLLTHLERILPFPA